ncbi:hypothetical protein AJ79_01883 [Helicocarpus griseus UAMH5409]|uniref:SGT1 and CS domain-containing protein n=1 Tax=Helicocarpus griseus UAMH5409 TaxID=1447875 RepID=A0A2B7Y5Q4_9EURO|nr:hypothetical protein AJ79_01883 [Helicocarpus griseus UAMH5409]
MDDAARGSKALSAADYRPAITHYTRALLTHPHATDYYIKRSTAYSRLRPEDGGPNGDAALHDAEMAVALGVKRGRREHIIAGQMRRAVVLYQLGRIGDARFLFEILRKKVGESSKGTMEGAMSANNSAGGGEKKMQQELDIWEVTSKNAMEGLEEGDESLKVGIKEYPDFKVPAEDVLRETLKKELAGAGAGADAGTAGGEKATGDKGVAGQGDSPSSSTNAQQQAATQSSATPQAPAVTKVRHEWYQSHDNVVVTLYAKGVPKEKADIDIKEDSLSITFPLPTGSDFSFNLDPLFASVDASTSKATVMSTKVEIILRKKQPGQKWAALEDTSRTVGSDSKVTSTIPTAVLSSRPTNTGAPSYPTSSRTGPKNWDQVAASLIKKKKKTSSKGNGERAEGDKDADDEGALSDNSDYGTGDPVDGLFKKIYADSDADTRRAMVKSFYESEGTALSTNWAEVSKGKVEARPPSDA